MVLNNTRSDSLHPPFQPNNDGNFSIIFVNSLAGGVGAARNAGIAASTGNLIRFLDDDDFLLPSVAEDQYFELHYSDADLSTYSGRLEDINGLAYKIITPGCEIDYGSAVLSGDCPALTFATVYKSSYIKNSTWNEEWRVSEDEDWMRRMLDKRVPNWITSEIVVGVWYQHSGPRLSPAVATHLSFKYRALSIYSALERMKANGILRPEHKVAAARGIWSAIHGGFPFAPFYWTEASKLALELDPRSGPRDEFFYRFSAIPAVILEWIILPKRWFNHLTRLVRARFSGGEYRRNF